MKTLCGATGESCVSNILYIIIGVAILSGLCGLMVNGDGFFHTLAHVGPEEDDDNDNEEEEDNDGGNDNTMEDVEMLEAGLINNNDGAPQNQKKKRREHSDAHDDILAKKMVYVHLDLEHIGKYVIQISVTFMNYKLEATTEWTSYIKPPADAVWEEHACRSHKLRPRDVQNAGSMLEVLPKFKEAVEKELQGGKVGMLVAWGGKGADCGKLFEITEVLYRGVLEMPQGLKYFHDPIIALKYKRNPFHESKRQQDVPVGYGIGTIYSIMYGQMFPSHHNSVFDARAQATIFSDPRFQTTFDKPQCVVLMDDVWGGKQKREAEYTQEPTRAVPLGYVDSGMDTYEPPRSMSYHGPSGGGQVGPTSALTQACATRDLADLFSFYFTNDMLDTIATETNRYGNGDWVRPVSTQEWRELHENDGQPRSHNGNDTSRAASDVQFDFSAMDESTALFDQSHELNSAYDESNDSTYGPGRHLVPNATDGSEDTNTVSSTRGRDCDSDPGSYDGSCYSDDDELDESQYELEPKRRERLVPCNSRHRDKRHRFKPSKGNEWVDVNIGYLYAFFGINFSHVVVPSAHLTHSCQPAVDRLKYSLPLLPLNLCSLFIKAEVERLWSIMESNRRILCPSSSHWE